MPAQTLFAFSVVDSKEATIYWIKQAVAAIGGHVQPCAGYLECSWKRKGALLPMKFEFYIGQVVRVVPAMRAGADLSMALRVTFKPDCLDRIWERFVASLLSVNPDFDLSVGTPVVDSVMYADAAIKQVYKSKNTPSYGKAVLGGALFGETGALVGALNGTTRTTGHTTAADQVYVKVRMSNGRVREGNLPVNSREYNQIMANLE